MKPLVSNRSVMSILLLAALLFVPCGSVLAGDEEHQAVRGVRAAYEGDMAQLRLTVLLGNGDKVERVYADPGEIDALTRVLMLAQENNVRLYASLDANKDLKRLFVEFGAPIVYEPER